MHLDIHALHTVPYSNLNRDALGSPKNTLYGGELRTRVSSQSWKRAVRLEVEKQLEDPTLRTRHVPAAVRKVLTEAHAWDSDTARKAGRAVLVAADAAAKRRGSKEGGILPSGSADQSKVLFWVPQAAIRELAELCTQHREAIAATTLPASEPADEAAAKGARKPKAPKEPKQEPVLPTDEVNEILRRRSRSINLLGRMLAEMPGHGVDGATLFAHAFTTHSTATDFDFFTAVDDWNHTSDDEDTVSGSGHLATAEYSSGVFYRYSSVNITDLACNLDSEGKPTPESIDEALRIADVYLRAFVSQLPSGKQNTTAAVTRPEFVYLAVRDQPLSLAGAFEKPVRLERGEGFAGPSRDRLDDYTGKLHGFLGTDGLHWHGHAGLETARGDGSPFASLGDHHTGLHDLITEATNHAGDHA
ncbi:MULTISPECIES: type I-E CRISPR-associated protein Cas7/Cse4/CasC [unclassified Saccharopolyspora]|uniref:type I-E CRISPR-associated protein Cas7/Cse4/CasC n=1 Tax=unclassified Saccharopolyspora TaxID=2646250 RepID=UPI001CD328E4|nr:MULTISPECIES: type I-E CRISPR-associated protein Cas7/Cse4/CasC [unclassified Saccharopolyspora]MCA1188774.1 type I-E CRISPR-associated protein Cas7/Cse4/CasC [Saccharopolyspora sp. 6T]MCA1283266.1 type I-E CRISPR-associated protein Cas7/Cse4/CasC [Saccharopolyspora sp. 7B]